MLKQKIAFVIDKRSTLIKLYPVYKKIRSSTNIDLVLIHVKNKNDKINNVFFYPDVVINIKQSNLLTKNDDDAKDQYNKLQECIESICPKIIITSGSGLTTSFITNIANKMNIIVCRIGEGSEQPDEIEKNIDYNFVTNDISYNYLKKRLDDEKKIHIIKNTIAESIELFSESNDTTIKCDTDYVLVVLNKNSTHFNKIKGIKDAIIVISKKYSDNLTDLSSKIYFFENIQYHDFIKLIRGARYVITDSRNVQDETTILKIKCYTFGKNTERSHTLIENGGTNILIDSVDDINDQNNILNTTKYKTYDVTVADKIKTIYFFIILSYLDTTCGSLKHDFGDLTYELYFLEIISSYMKLAVLGGEKYENNIMFKISDLYKIFLKKYSVMSCTYAYRGFKSINSKQRNLVQYVENVVYVYQYNKALDELMSIKNKLCEYDPIIELYIGLLKYQYDIDGYSLHIQNYVNNKKILKEKIYLDVPMTTYCINTKDLNYSAKTKECYIIENIKLSNLKMIYVCSCDIIYFKLYYKFLFKSFTDTHKKDYLLFVDLIMNEENNDVITLVDIINKYCSNILINIKTITEKNIKAYSSSLRLVRALNILNYNNIPVLVIDFDSCFITNLDVLFYKMVNYDIATRQLKNVYPWQKYTCGFIFFNNTNKAKEILKCINYHLNDIIRFDTELWWIDQNAIEIGLRDVKCTIIDVFTEKNKYIISPTGNVGTKTKMLEKTIDMLDYENIIIFAHPDDETIFFYDFIHERTLLILVTKPNDANRMITLEKLVLHKGCKLICLDEVDKYSANDISAKVKEDILNIILTTNYNSLITHGRNGEYGHFAHKAIYKFISDLNLKNSFTINYNAIKAGGMYRKELYKYKKRINKCDEYSEQRYLAIKNQLFDDAKKLDKFQDEILHDYANNYVDNDEQYIFFSCMSKYAYSELIKI
jgi:UDP-N-acetylglucosamine 2-epimerase (non-hydrolysing)